MASTSRGPKGLASRRRLRRVLMVCAMVAALGSCATPGPDDDRSAAQTGAAVEAQQTPAGRVYHTAGTLARPEARLRALLASRPEAWSPAGEHFESLALSGPAGQWLEGVGARAALRADLPLEIGAGASAEKRIWLTPVDARPAPVAVHEGHLIYEEAYQGTDLVLAAEQERVEVLFVLRHGGAPNRFAWRLTHGAKLPHARLTDDGEVAFEDAPGHAVLRVPRAFALDAKGTRREARLDVADGVLSVALDTTGLEYPVLLDPAFERAVWDNVTPGTSPGVRGDTGLVFDTSRNVAILFGGIDSSTRLGDTWEWNGSAWTSRCASGACGLTARRAFASAFDNNTGRNVMVIFGGTDGTPKDETWEWNGSAWSQKCTTAPCSTAGNHPAARMYASMAYDSTRHVSVFFGGTTNDTWTWDGTTWTLKCANGVCAAPARNWGAMAFDSNRGVAVYFGGVLRPSGTETNEVWEWDGSTWAQKCTASPCTDSQPVARSYPALAYDSTTKRVVLFGGFSTALNAYQADTWQWDGSVWTQVSGTAPIARGSHGMAYDPAHKRVVLFGGVDKTTYYADTWLYHSRGRDCSTGGAAICDTGYCVDNVCCETACATPCYACDQAGTEGACTLLPRNAHDTYPTNACVNPKACDGNGSCIDDYGVSCSAGTTCASGKCVDSRCCDTDCLGTCMGCNLTGHLGTCWNLDLYAHDSNATVTCLSPKACNGSGSCLNENGQTCTGGCASGNCVDSVCCDTTCTTACMGCAVSGHSGTCYNLPQYAEDTYPANACVDGAYKMSCNGSGLCKRDNGEVCGNGTDCVSGNCVDGVCCNTACMGTCMACNLTGHVGTCFNLDRYAHDTNATATCVSPKACDGSGNCYNENGQACTGGCASGSCVDSVCCDTTCPDLCQACNVSAHVGTCWNVDRYSVDTDSGCVAPNACNGSGFCRKANGQPCPSGLGSECASDNCVDGVCCDTSCAGMCMGCAVASHVGTCYNLPQYTQDNFPLGACIGNNTCDGAGGCKKQNGQTCPGGNGDCASGNCVDGVCCDTTCTGTCKACNVSGHVGACTNLPQYTQDTFPTNACTGNNTCDGSGNCKKQNGQTCPGGAGDCASGNCVDGVCCDTACNTACWACNLGGSGGTCSKIAQYTQDTWPANICTGNNTCDGNGSCKYQNGQTCPSGAGTCASNYCVDGVCCSTGCGGQCKSCNVGGSVGTCSNTPKYVHDDNSSPACQAPDTCDGQGNCLSENGQDCSNGSTCASGNCVDGKCCDTACTETCKACTVSGSVGTCTNIPMNGQDNWPANTCVAPMGCDGFGVCRKANGQPCPNGSSDCASLICVEGVCCNDLCTGMCKSCLVAGSVGACTNLPRYAHDTYPTDSCIAPSSCDGSGACKLENGGSCGSNPALCASGNCVDGRCCDTACTTACWACNVPGSEGTCSKLAQNSADSFPGNACIAPNACDGNGLCKLAQGEACSAASQCASGFCTDNKCCAVACDAPCKTCAAGGVCLNIASGFEDLVATLPCTLPNGSCDGAGHCKRVRGQPCGGPDDCVEGICADSVCCDSACEGPCRSCNQVGSVGTCKMYPANTDPESECGSGTCGGKCDGLAGCTYQPTTLVCLLESCASGSHQVASYCDGTGGCTLGLINDCTPYECDTAQPTCLAKCVDDGDCQHAFWCDASQHCVADLADAQPCDRNAQCTSDRCVDGVCCNEACTGNCQYCGYTDARKGICSPVDVGDDPKLKCQAATGGTQECAGACDATGQCAFPDVGTICGLCSACDGTGRCTATPADDSQCGTIDCSGLDTTCRTYDDLNSNRCASLGACKTENDPSTCTSYTDLSCSDGGSVQADSGHPQEDAGTDTGGKSGGCRVAGAEPAAGAPLLLGLAAWAWRRRRRR
jgi:hypothetical protein